MRLPLLVKLPRTAVLLAPGALALALTGLWPAAAAASSAPGAAPAPITGSSAPVEDSSEAWYDTSPTTLCSSPVGCPPVTVTSGSYPANTLHVAVAAGTETARTYVLPDLSTYAGGGLPGTGTMTLPLATVSGNGNANDPVATIEACLAKAPFPNGTQGSSSPPPATDCSVHASVRFESTSFTMDLSPFLAAWKDGSPEYGIALLPDPGSAGPSTNWHVAFNGKYLAGASHITSIFGPAPASTGTVSQAGVPAAVPPAAAPPTGGGGTGGETTGGAAPAGPYTAAVGGTVARSTPAPGSAAPSLPAPSLPAPSLPASSTATSPGAAAAGSTGTGNDISGGAADLVPASSSSGGFQYPEILLLPLVIAAAIVFAVRLLRSDATPRRLRSRRL